MKLTSTMQQQAHRHHVPGVGRAILESFPDRGVCGSPSAGVHRHHDERNEGGELGHAVHQKTERLAGDGQQHAGDGQRPSSVALYIPELNAIALGKSSRLGTTSGRKDWRMGASMAITTPSSDAVTMTCQTSTASSQTQRGKGEAGDSRGRLRHDQELLAVHPVGPQAAERRQHEDCDLAGEGRHAEQQGRARQAADEPSSSRICCTQ